MTDANNRYYIINADDPNLNTIIGYCVGYLYTQRYNLAQTQLVIKLHDGDTSEHEELNGYTEYDHEGILEALNNDEWRVLPI